MKSKLTITPSCFTCFTQICQLCVYRGVFEKTFWCGYCSMVIFAAKKATKGTKLQFLCTQDTLQGGRVEDHRMMSTRHLHKPQLYIQAILYIYIKIDCMISLSLYTLRSVYIFSILFCIHFLMCWQGEFVKQSRGSSINYHFLLFS